MAYDLFCYRSQLGKPDLDEAQNTIEEDEQNEFPANTETKLKIATALLRHNPRLQSSAFDPGEIESTQGQGIDEAQKSLGIIQLNTADDELTTQILINNDSVSISVPYWYSGHDAQEIFKTISEYTKVIGKTAGYFVFDPQTETVYDPLTQEPTGFDTYERTTLQMAHTDSEQALNKTKKPWWKFW